VVAVPEAKVCGQKSELPADLASEAISSWPALTHQSGRAFECPTSPGLHALRAPTSDPLRAPQKAPESNLSDFQGRCLGPHPFALKRFRGAMRQPHRTVRMQAERAGRRQRREGAKQPLQGIWVKTRF